jgi:hypothetical protein
MAAAAFTAAETAGEGLLGWKTAPVDGCGLGGMMMEWW